VPALLRRPLEFVRSLHRHGDLVRIYFARLPVYVVTQPAALHDMLVTNGRYVDRGRIFEKGRAFLGDGLITSADDLHHRQRRLVQPAFHRKLVERYAEGMPALAAECVRSWRAGVPVAVPETMNHLAFTMVTRAMFGVDICPSVAERLHRGLPLLLRASILRAFTPDLLERLPIGLNRHYTSTATAVRSVVDELLASHHDTMQAGQVRDPDVVSMLRSAREGGTGAAMSPTMLRDEVLTIVVAGTETTGGALSWVFYELARHPDVEERVHREIDTVLGGRPVCWSDVPRLEYTQRVLRETLRLHTMWISTRRALRPVQIGGVDVPAGTELAFSQYALHRDPRLFHDPDVFDPDRWSPQRSAQLPRGGYLPFLAGNRQCIGNGFAWTEMVIVIATVAARWRLHLPARPRVREVATAMVRPNSLTMLPIPRPRRSTGAIPSPGPAVMKVRCSRSGQAPGRAGSSAGIPTPGDAPCGSGHSPSTS
jgi:cytochrome P450